MFLLKERSSALGHLMVGAELSGKRVELGKMETDRLVTIYDKINRQDKLTPKMQEDYIALKYKMRQKVKPELSKGAKTHIRNKWYGHEYQFQKVFSNKFTRNGNEQEDSSISQVGGLIGYNFARKNEQHFENDFTHGTPDWITKNFVFDVKNVFEPNGLDFSEALDPVYYWQLISYLWLTGRTEGAVIKVLCNKSEGIIRQAAKTYWEQAGNNWFDPIPEDFIDEVRDLLDFESRMPIEDRVNFYPVKLQDHHPKLIEQQINLSREYYAKWQEEVNQERTKYKSFVR
jgi:hypothetical protein